MVTAWFSAYRRSILGLMLLWAGVGRLCSPAPLTAMDDVGFIGAAPAFVAASPGDGATGLTPNATLTWSFTGASTYDLYFGTSNPPPLFSAGLTVTSAAPAQAANTQYYWQVDAINGSGNTTTSVFTFTTGAPASSNKNSGPCAINGAPSTTAGWIVPAAALLGFALWAGIWRRIAVVEEPAR